MTGQGVRQEEGSKGIYEEDGIVISTLNTEQIKFKLI